MEQLEAKDHEIVAAVEHESDGDADLDFAAGDGEAVGFVETGVDEAPTVFDRPDRLVVCELYVNEDYRGEGLALELMGRAADRAREEGCGEVRLDVDVENERAIGLYEKLGFEPTTYRMLVDAGTLSVQTR